MPRWIRLLLLFGLLPAMALSMPPLERVAPAVHGNDGFLNYAYARSLLVGGDLDFADDYAAFESLGRGYPFSFLDTPRDPETGRSVNRYGWGSALLWSPGLAVAHAAQAVGIGPAGERPPGLSAGHFAAVRLMTALWGMLGVVLLLDVARRRLDLRHPWTLPLTALALLGATNLPFYLWLHPSMSTAPAFGLAGIALWLIDRLAERQSLGIAALLGLTLGMLGATRYGDLGFLFGLGVVVVVMVVGREEMSAWKTAGVFVAGAGPVIVVQMLVWNAIYGSPLSGPAPYVGEEYAWQVPGRHGFAVLFSAHHGWVRWHPGVAAGLMGCALLAARRALPLWLRLTPLAVVGQWLLVSAWPEWTGGASFGGRLMATALAPLTFGLALALDAALRRAGRAPVLAVLLILSVWNALLALAYGLGRIPREAPVSEPEMLRGALSLFGL